jgi:hypothetical protein
MSEVLVWKLWRLSAHVLGYVPYLTVWSILLHSFDSNVTEEGPPDFVWAIVIGQFVIFTGFGFTQLFNQGFDKGPYWYWRGEMSYLVLSLLSKGVLGMILITNVLLYSTFSEGVAVALESGSGER